MAISFGPKPAAAYPPGLWRKVKNMTVSEIIAAGFDAPVVNNNPPVEASEASEKPTRKQKSQAAKRGRPRKTDAGFDRAAYMREYRKRRKVVE